MRDSDKNNLSLPPEQQAIRDKCFHPSGKFVEFPSEDIETSIPARFEKLVRTYPERLAVVTQEKAWTYTALNSVANGIARTILERLGNEAKPIVLLFGKGAEQIASILAVLKAGKFFVLLDPAFPHAQMRAIFEASLAQGIVTDHENSGLAMATAKIGRASCRERV